MERTVRARRRMNALLDIWVVREIVLPVLDVLLLGFLIYRGYQILAQTRAVQLVRGALLLGGLYAVAFLLNLTTVRWIIDLLAPTFVIGLAIIFQPELRKIFTRIGQASWLSSSQKAQAHIVDTVMSAVDELARSRTGALIVFSRSVGQKNVIETGTQLDAEVSRELILSIFENGSALHDGAMIIEGGRAASAGSFLPLSDQLDIRRSFGTRHRAALGLAEETDALVVVVSEETGAISLANDANLYYDLGRDEVRLRLIELLESETSTDIRRVEEIAEVED